MQSMKNTIDYSVLEASTLFNGVPAKVIEKRLNETPHHIRHFDKGETIFHLMESAHKIGIILQGKVEAQKLFPNGSQINVSVRGVGKMIGTAATFSKQKSYPCDLVAIEKVTLLIFSAEEIVRLIQKDIRILQNITSELASITYRLQERLELFSYRGIAQKLAFYLLLKSRQSESEIVRIPKTISNLAQIMNVSRPSLHRELKRFVRKKIISYAPPLITIRNADALEKELDD